MDKPVKKIHRPPRPPTRPPASAELTADIKQMAIDDDTAQKGFVEDETLDRMRKVCQRISKNPAASEGNRLKAVKLEAELLGMLQVRSDKPANIGEFETTTERAIKTAEMIESLLEDSNDEV